MSQFIRLAVPRRQKAPTNSIVINATPTPFTCETSGLYIKPIRGHHQATEKSLYYNAESGEVYYADTSGDFNIDSYWEPDGQYLTPSGSFVGLNLSGALVVGGAASGAGNVFAVSFSTGNQFAFSNTADGDQGGYMINDQPVADRSKYLQITTNNTNITTNNTNITTNNTNILSVSGRVYTLEHAHHPDLHNFWKEADSSTLTPSGGYNALALGTALIDGSDANHETLTFTGYTAGDGGTFALRAPNATTWHFGYSGGTESVVNQDNPAYLINGVPVATSERHIQISVNEAQISDICGYVEHLNRGAASHWRNIGGYDGLIYAPGAILEPSSNHVNTIYPNNSGVHWGVIAQDYKVYDFGRIELGCGGGSQTHAQVTFNATVPSTVPDPSGTLHSHNRWQFGVSGGDFSDPYAPGAIPGIFINDQLVSNRSSYNKIFENSGNITTLITDVSDISACCHDNSSNIHKIDVSLNALITDVSDISGIVNALITDVSDISACCHDNSSNIHKIDVSLNALITDVSDISACCYDNSATVLDLSTNFWNRNTALWSTSAGALQPANDAATFHTLELTHGLFAAGEACTAIGAGANPSAHPGNVAIGYQCKCDGSGGGQVALGKSATTTGNYQSGAHDGITLDYKPFVYADGSGTQFAFGYDVSGTVSSPALLVKQQNLPWVPLASTQVSISGNMDNMWTDLTGKIYPSANAGSVHTLELQKHGATSGTNGGKLIMGGAFADYTAGTGSSRSAYMTIAPIGAGVGGMPSPAAAAAFPSGGTFLVEQIGDNGSCPSGTYFTFGGISGSTRRPAIFINTDVVADASSYAMIGENSGNISTLIIDVSDISACCHDNSSNIHKIDVSLNALITDVSDISACCHDNSSNIHKIDVSLNALITDVSDISACCYDNSSNIYKIDVSLNALITDVSDISGIVNDLFRVHTHGQLGGGVDARQRRHYVPTGGRQPHRRQLCWYRRRPARKHPPPRDERVRARGPRLPRG